MTDELAEFADKKATNNRHRSKIINLDRNAYKTADQKKSTSIYLCRHVH